MLIWIGTTDINDLPVKILLQVFDAIKANAKLEWVAKCTLGLNDLQQEISSQKFETVQTVPDTRW